MSKLDYLKKYSISNENKSHKKKSSKVIRIIDADDEWRSKPIKTNTSKNYQDYGNYNGVNDDEDDDDGPVIVETTNERVSSIIGISRWEDVSDSNNNNNVNYHNINELINSNTILENEAVRTLRQTIRRKLDSDSEEDVPRRRIDSDDEDSPRKRVDSDDEEVNKRKIKSNANIRINEDYSDDEAVPRRRRVDSDDEAVTRRNINESEQLNKRIDSDDEDLPRRRAYSDDEDLPRKRVDSDDEDIPRKRLGSDDETVNKKINSDSDRSNNNAITHKRKYHNVDTDVNILESKVNDDKINKRRMSSGHVPGLQSGQTFGINEKELIQKRDIELSNINDNLSGKKAETTYRDKQGKKVDMLSEYMKNQAINEGKKAKLEQLQYEWGKGTVQKEQELKKLQELDDIANEPFARTIDDPKLEEYKKSIIHVDDPMANYFEMKKLKKEMKKEKKSKKHKKDKDSNNNDKVVMKPKYKGVAPINRFNIAPGYRWDGVDRSNGYELKVLNISSNLTSNKDDEYKWLVSDM